MTTDPWLSLPTFERLLARGSAAVVPPSTCRRFVEYLDSLPWLGPHLDWDRLGGSRLSMVDAPDAVAWVRALRIGRHPFVMAVRRPEGPGIVSVFDAMFTKIDELAWKAPGAFFLCGSTTLDPVSPVFEDFVEYDGVESLKAI